MRSRTVGLLVFVVVAVGVVVGVYFASQLSDGTTGAVEGTPVPTPIPRQSAPDVVPTPPPSPTPTPTPTPTPQPGVCPTPKRTAPVDFAKPPPVLPASEIFGQRVQGGVPYSEGYVTVHLPAGRQFIITSALSQDKSNRGISGISIYDVQTASYLTIHGDGCEMSRFVREAAADAVFDEVMRSLEIGSTYACPIPVRTTYEDLPVQQEPPPADGSGLPGRRVQGGVPFELGPITLHLPADREFLVSGGVSDPGGEFFSVYDIETRSGLFLRPDGCETSRLVWDPAADAVLDEIVATLSVTSR
jgi:hypothetical protein